MADATISIYGVHRPKYVLGWVLACLLGSGCTDSDSLSARFDPPQIPNGWQTLLSGDQTNPQPLAPVSLPEDLAPHPDASAESFSIRGLVVDQQQRVVSVSAQLDRIRVLDDVSGSSDWSFSSVFRAQASIAGEGEMRSGVHELIERGALGLADSDELSLFVGSNQLKIEPGDLNAADGKLCHVDVSIDANLVPDRMLALTAQLPACPMVMSVGQVLNQWEALAVQVSGSLQSSAVAGHLWITHTWGQPPQPGGAVLLDQLRLRVVTATGDILLINANRSRRRSGRGPVTVLGTLFNAQGDAEPVELQWTDTGSVTSDVTGIDYATGYRVSSQALDLDLSLLPVVPLSEIADALGVRWSGAVNVSGTHEGIGFVDIAPALAVANQE